MKVVYVAGAYSGDEQQNVLRALDAGDALIENGLVPIVPHLSHFWHGLRPKEYETWMWIDFELVRRADGLWRLSGPSSGADREVALAREIGKPVFNTLDEVLSWAKENR